MDVLESRHRCGVRARLGKGRMSGPEFRLGAHPIFIGSLVIITSLRSTFSALRPYVPSAAWADWIFRVGVVAIFLVGFVVIWRKLRQVESSATFQERLDEFAKQEAAKDKMAERMGWAENR